MGGGSSSTRFHDRQGRHFDPQDLPAGDLLPFGSRMTVSGPESTVLHSRKCARRSGFSVERHMRSLEVLRTPGTPRLSGPRTRAARARPTNVSLVRLSRS
jgi:hypothetical protein